MEPEKTFEAVDYKTVKITIDTPQIIFVDIEALTNDVNAEQATIDDLQNQILVHQANKDSFQSQIDEATANVVLPPAPEE